jgi:hypothetical protein
MPTKIFKTHYQMIARMTRKNECTLNENVRRVLLGADEYFLVTGEKHGAGGNTTNSRTKQCNQRTGQTDAPAIIIMPCSDNILTHIRINLHPADFRD